MKTETPTAPDGIAVFCAALAWTGFGGPLMGNRLGPWSVPVFTLGLALIPLVACAALRFNFRRTFSLSRTTPSLIAAGLVLSSGLLIVSVLASVGLARFFPDLPISGKALRTDITGASLPYLVVTVALLPAVCEELLFRGFILTSLAGRNKTLAIFACGTLFGFLHLEIAQMPMSALIGMALSWACLETGSVFAPVAMHAFHNLALLLMVRYGTALVPTTLARVLLYATIAAALIDAGVVLLRKSSRGADKAVY